MNSSIILTLLALAGIGFSVGEDSKEACETLSKCLQEAYDVRKSCENISNEIAARWPAKNQSETQIEIAKMLISYNEMTNWKRLDKIKCLQERSNKTVLVTCDLLRKGNCTEFIAAYKPRTKRQALASTTATLTASTSATVSTPTVAGATNLTVAELAEQAAENAEKAAEVEVKQKKEEAAKALALVREEKAKAAQADRDVRTKLQTSLNECNKKATEIETECSRLAGCCSENTLCDWLYQAKNECAEYFTLQFKLQVARRMTTCPVPKPALALASTPTSSSTVASLSASASTPSPTSSAGLASSTSVSSSGPTSWLASTAPAPAVTPGPTSTG